MNTCRWTRLPVLQRGHYAAGNLLDKLPLIQSSRRGGGISGAADTRGNIVEAHSGRQCIPVLGTATDVRGGYPLPFTSLQEFLRLLFRE